MNKQNKNLKNHQEKLKVDFRIILILIYYKWNIESLWAGIVFNVQENTSHIFKNWEKIAKLETDYKFLWQTKLYSI